MVGTMTGAVYFGTYTSLVLFALVSVILFVYVWVSSHGVENIARFHRPHVDAMAGDEGEE